MPDAAPAQETLRDERWALVRDLIELTAKRAQLVRALTGSTVTPIQAAAERARLARELHDGVLQELVALTIELDAMRQVPVTETTLLGAALDQSAATARQAVADLRAFLTTLRAATGQEPLQQHLSGVIERFRLARQLRIDFTIAGDAIRPAAALNAAFSGVLTEALANASKHAPGCLVTVSLRQAADEIDLVVRDDGPGFPFEVLTGDTTKSGHYGLVGMGERVNAIHGQLALKNHPDGGALVQLRWPARPENGW